MIISFDQAIICTLTRLECVLKILKDCISILLSSVPQNLLSKENLSTVLKLSTSASSVTKGEVS